MRQFWTHHVRPALEARYAAAPRRRVLIRCMGVSESSLQQRLNPFLGEPGLTISFRTKLPENQVKLIFDPRPGEVEVSDARVRDTLDRALAVIGESCFGTDIDAHCGEIGEVVGALLADRGETVATAESCTGGQISAQLTAIAGSSRYFLEGACVYSNAAKVRTCGVRQEDLDAVGAVSEEVARGMAEGIRDRAGATYGISTTGIAGPGGGRPGKPVGTVHVALATPGGTLHRELSLHGERDRVTAVSAGLALDMLRRHLQSSLNPSFSEYS
jgi:nicotinamide-nucleotide amidase